MVPGQKLWKEGSGPAVDSTLFKQIVGSLRYLAATRPALIFSVNLVSGYMENPVSKLSDIMTKAVTLDVFEKLRGSMGVCSKEV